MLNLNSRELITFVGAGGKTTTMFALAKSLKAAGKKTLVATTTKILAPEKDLCDAFIFDSGRNMSFFEKIEPETITCLGKKFDPEKNKIVGVDSDYIDELFQCEIFDYILVEADGARQKPIKAPADHEPIVPLNTTISIGIIGLDSLGAIIDKDSVHRPEIFAEITNRKLGDKIDCDIICKLILSDRGLFKNTPPTSRRIVILNKKDLLHDKKETEIIVERVIKKTVSFEAIIANTKNGVEISI